MMCSKAGELEHACMKTPRCTKVLCGWGASQSCPIEGGRHKVMHLKRVQLKAMCTNLPVSNNALVRKSSSAWVTVQYVCCTSVLCSDSGHSMCGLPKARGTDVQPPVLMHRCATSVWHVTMTEADSNALMYYWVGLVSVARQEALMCYATVVCHVEGQGALGC